MNHPVLVIRLSSLGDIILTQPVVETIAAAGHDVELWVKPEYRELAAMLPGVARVIVKPEELASQYHAVLDLHATGRARRASRQAQGPVWRYAKHSIARRRLVRPWGRPVFWNHGSGLAPQTCVTDWYAAAAVAAGFPRATGKPRLAPTSAQTGEAAMRLARLGIQPDQPYLVLAPGARWPSKQWPLAYFVQTARQAQARWGWSALFLGGLADRAACQAAVMDMSSGAAALCGEPWPVVAGVLARSQALVANDSGPMHAGLAAGAPTVLLAGPTVAAFGFFPAPGPGVRVLEHELPCRPCSLHGSIRCPLGHHQCLRGIQPESVVQALDALRTEKRSAHA